MAANLPGPLVVPAGGWYGNYGSFTGFTVQIGSSGQSVDLWPATQLDTLATTNWDCSTSVGCNDDFEFDPDQSSTWGRIGWQDVPINTHFQYTAHATYGSDSVSIASTPQNANGGSQNVTVEKQIIASWEKEDYVGGFLGLGKGEFATITESYPSLLESLYGKGRIPSLSFGLTAGAKYENTSGSLVLGGVDTARFDENSTISMELSQNKTAVATLRSFSIVLGNSNETIPVSQAAGLNYTAGFDSVTPFIYATQDIIDVLKSIFPVSSCGSNYYCWDSSNTSALAATKNASISFTISSPSNSSETLTTTLPFSALVMDVTAGKIETNATQILPFRVLSTTAGQPAINFGRAFLQQAYMAVDYARGNFSISNAVLNDTRSDIVAITPTVRISNSTSAEKEKDKDKDKEPVDTSKQATSLSSAQIIPIVLACVLLPILILAGYCFEKRRDRWKTRGQIQEIPKGSRTSSSGSSYISTTTTSSPSSSASAPRQLEEARTVENAPTELPDTRSYMEMPANWVPAEMGACWLPVEMPAGSLKPLPRTPEGVAGAMEEEGEASRPRDSGGWRPRQTLGWGLIVV